jgi:hypothetical protein
MSAQLHATLCALIREMSRQDHTGRLADVVRKFNQYLFDYDALFDQDTTPDDLAINLSYEALKAWDDVFGLTEPGTGIIHSHFAQLSRPEQEQVLGQILNHPDSPIQDTDPDLSPLAGRYGDLRWIGSPGTVKKTVQRLLVLFPRRIGADDSN